MYYALLFVHSWLRWVVLLATAYVIARAVLGVQSKRDWQPSDQRATFVLHRLVDVQFTLGLLLYVWLSPIVRSAFADMGAAMRSAPLRFFAVEHITAMIIAIAVLHIGGARNKRLAPAARHGGSLRWTLGFLFCVCAGIPWPGLKQGRPLARTSVGSGEEAPPTTPEVYQKRCSVCHGTNGRGDGTAAAAMEPKPRDFADVTWQRSVSDQQLRDVILQGGSARNLSTTMPPHPDLNQQQVDELIRYLRSLAVAP